MNIKEVFATDSTDHRSGGHPYVVAVHPEVQRAIAPRGWAVAEIEYITSERLFIVVRLLVSEDRLLQPSQARVDQTVRTALGLPVVIPQRGSVRVDLRLAPLKATFGDRVRNATSSLVGRRYLILRVAQPDPIDIEKRVARVLPDDLAALGADVGSRLVFFGAVRMSNGSYRLTRKSMQALPLETEAIAVRRDLEMKTADRGWSARYRSAPSLLAIDGPDLHPVFIDRDDRGHLGIDRAWPVLVRRDSRSAMARVLQDFGVALLASLLAIGGVANPVLDEHGVSVAWQGTIVLIMALLVAVVLVVVRLRSDLR